jgi:hypothetical protein
VEKLRPSHTVDRFGEADKANHHRDTAARHVLLEGLLVREPRAESENIETEHATLIEGA